MAKPGSKFEWKEGDLVTIKEGKGEPMISEEELTAIINDNRKEQNKKYTWHDKKPKKTVRRPRELSRKGGTQMAQAYEWSKLTTLQVGRYAEYFVKMQFVLRGFDVYSPEVDDRGIDFVLRRGADYYWDVQCKSVRTNNPRNSYFYIRKDKFRIRPNLLLAFVLFRDHQEPELFLIRATEWLQPNDGVLVARDFEGLKSKPEYGIKLSKKGIAALEKYRFDDTLETLLISE